MTLSQQLRSATKALHTQAERAGLMPRLLRGELPLERYVLLLRQLLAIYEALESALRQPGAPEFDPGMARAAALRADIAWLAPQGPADPLTHPAREYVARLQTLPPVQLAAHAYVRYLGDLAGGQVLARIVGRAYGLQQEGLAFYRFEADAPTLVLGLREVLDALPEAEQPAIVAEAQAAFGRHIDLFEALA
jgi:heme oxygenase